MYLRTDERRPTIDAAARAAGRDPGRRRAGAVRGDLLPPLVPAGALRRQVPGRGERQPRPRDQGRGAARRDRRPQRRRAGRQPHRAGAAGHPAEAARRRRRAPSRAGAASATLADMPLRRIRRDDAASELKVAAVRPGDAQAATSATTSSTTCRRTRPTSPGSRSSASSCAGTRRRRSARTCSARRRDRPKELQGAALPRAASRATASARRGRVRVRPLPARAQRRRPASRSTRSGRPKGELAPTPPKPGDSLRLSIDSGVQEAGEAALAARGPAGRRSSRWTSTTAQVLGLGSNPSFDPNVFTKPIDPVARYNALPRPRPRRAAHRPRDPRASTRPGSTFKLITAMAALNERPDHARDPDHRRRLAHRRRRSPSRTRAARAYGALALPSALQVSDDVFFYTLGLRTERRRGELSRSGRTRSGSAARPGIDLPGEAAGLLPTPSLAQPPLPQGPHRPPLVGGRQHQPRRRPGRPAGRPAADGRRLRDDRQRRHRGHARTSGMQVEDTAGPRRAGDRAAAAAPRQDRPASTARRSSTACTWRRRPREAPPTRSSAASRSRSPARPAPRERDRPGATSPGTSVLAPYPNPQHRRRGDDRARAASAPTRPPRSRGRSSPPTSTRKAHAVGGASGGSPGLMHATTAARRCPPRAVRDPAGHRRAARDPLHRPAAAVRRRRPGRVQHLHPRRRRPWTTSRATATTTSSARRSTPASGSWRMLAADPDRLLALPRAAGRASTR